MHVRLAFVSLLLVSAKPAVAEPPDLGRVWKLNASMSQDIAERK